ncbi:MAG: hypothetical protein HPY73_08850 [Methanomassiliicoccales archaeon]|nr:MAG: hypothetical protein HPY73_08850 [Methanomassiliicoccales archaeon]
MIEFFLSKFWAVVCGMIILGAATTSISNLETASDERFDNVTFSSLVEEINSFVELEGSAKIVIQLGRLLEGPNTIIKIMKGGIVLYDEGRSKGAIIPSSIIILDGEGNEIPNGSSLIVQKGQCIVIQKDEHSQVVTLRVQDANVSTTFFTESTNISQSFSSL